MALTKISCVIGAVKSDLLRFIFSAFIAHLVLGCGNKDSTNLQNSQDAQKTRPVVFVPIAPYDFVFERLAGDLIEINVIVGEGDDPRRELVNTCQGHERRESILPCLRTVACRLSRPSPNLHACSI